MRTRITSLIHSTTLGEALPRAEFGSSFARVIEAPPELVWDALFDLRMSDLTVSRLLVRVRYLGRPNPLDSRLVDAASPGAPIFSERPRVATSGFLARPWEPHPSRGPRMADLAELRAFGDPGWLKLGVEFQLTELPGDRTYLRTTTLCEATDDAARRRFRPYWALIKPFSGLIRLDLLAALARRAATSSPRLVAVGQPAAAE